MILINEILSYDGTELLLKTIDPTRKLYGIYSTTRGHVIIPSLLHIFAFEETATTSVAVNQYEQYVTINSNGIVGSLETEGEELYRHYLIKNNRCNCYNLKLNISCGLCRGLGFIENWYAMKLVDAYWSKYDLD